MPLSRLRPLLWLWVLLFALPLQAAPDFPALTGRVVDGAGLLSVSARTQLEQQLATHEKESSNQVVVVTVDSLQGYPIEDYGYQLGRHWGIGQKGKDNGVLLIVAPNERKVRIEVGYGLEGVLTDALSKNIIETVITPPFKQGKMAQGIVAGTGAILAALGGSYEPNPVSRGGGSSADSAEGDNFATVLVIAFIAGVAIRFIIPNSLVGVLTSAVVAFVLGYFLINMVGAIVATVFSVFMQLGGSGGRGGGGYSSGGGGGGFSGGGGSFGGGGSSGSW